MNQPTNKSINQSTKQTMNRSNSSVNKKITAQYEGSAACTQPPAIPPTPPLREGKQSPAPASRLISYHPRYQTTPAARGREETYTKEAIRLSTRLPRLHPATGEVDPSEHASTPFRSETDPFLSSETGPRHDQPDPTLFN